jgi:hypothetical protein
LEGAVRFVDHDGMALLTDAPTTPTAPGSRPAPHPSTGRAAAGNDRFYVVSFAALIIGVLLSLGVVGAVAYDGSIAQRGADPAGAVTR